jgi:hypothetical protein
LFGYLSQAARDEPPGTVTLLRRSGQAVGVTLVAEGPEDQELAAVDESPMLVPLEGAGEDSQAEACVPADVDDGGFAEAADVQASAANPSCWLDVEGDRVHKITLVRHVFGRKGTSNDRTRRVLSMYGASSHSQAATPGIEDKDVICTGHPVSVLVQVGGRWAHVLAQETKLSAPGQSAPFSLPCSQAISKSTAIAATVLQLLPVVGETGVQAKADEQLWQWMGGMCAASL